LAILHELGFWPTDESANPDAEVLNALRLAMATVPGALLLAISSSHARRGELYKAFEQHFGRDEAKLLDGKITFTPTRDDSGKPGYER